MLGERVSILTFGDAGRETVLMNKKGEKVEFTQRDDKYNLEIEDYSDLIKSFKPDFYVTPVESIIKESGKNRREKAVKNARSLV